MNPSPKPTLIISPPTTRMLRMPHRGEPLIEAYIGRTALAKSTGTVLIFNGFGCPLSQWARVTPLLEAGGLNVVAFNARGIGKSGLGDVDRTNYVWTVAQDGIYLLLTTALEMGCKPPYHLLGHSMGALTMVAANDILGSIDDEHASTALPVTLTFVTPLLDSPDEFLPDGDWRIHLSALVTGWRYHRIMDTKMPEEAAARLRFTLALFDFASPMIHKLLRAPRATKYAFGEFLAGVVATEEDTRWMQFSACFRSGEELIDLLCAPAIDNPRRVLAILAHDGFDLLVHNSKARGILDSVFGDRLSAHTMRTGHFPHVEAPEEFADTYVRFLAGRKPAEQE